MIAGVEVGADLDSSSTACSAQARISTSSGESCSSRKPASMRATSRRRTRARRRAAARAARGCRRTASAGRGPRPARCRRVEVGGGDLRALVERHRRRPRTTRCRARSARSRASPPAARPSPRGVREPEEAPKYSTVMRSPSSRSARVKSAISSCSGSCPNVSATSRASIAFSSAAVHGPRARSPASMVRKPDRPDGLRRVGNQPEPKLIALSGQRERGALLQRRALDVRRAAAPAGGSVRA